MSESEWECSLCSWRGSEDSLQRHPSGPMGCPECVRTEGLRPLQTYLGDSTSARVKRCKATGGGESFVIYLWRDYSDGSEREIQMDPLVLSEFLDWLEDHDLIHDPWKREKEGP